MADALRTTCVLRLIPSKPGPAQRPAIELFASPSMQAHKPHPIYNIFLPAANKLSIGRARRSYVFVCCRLPNNFDFDLARVRAGELSYTSGLVHVQILEFYT
ncbi:hypothetical protein CBL_05293 [Carabus blaptoides fortunei]